MAFDFDFQWLSPGRVKDALRLNEPSIITNYLLDLAKKFHSGYNTLKVKGSDEKTAQARLLLFDCIRQVFENGFTMLGFRLLEEM